MVVSNTSPLVYLAALGDFEFLRELFAHIAIPRAVYREIAVGGGKLPVARAVEVAMTSWLSVMDITDISEANRLRQTGLHSGESEAIVLATEVISPALLMDDSDGIRAAAARGTNVIRTPGIYRMAKDRHLIPAVGPKLDGLRKAGFWLRDEHYRTMLRSLGEWPIRFGFLPQDAQVNLSSDSSNTCVPFSASATILVWRSSPCGSNSLFSSAGIRGHISDVATGFSGWCCLLRRLPQATQ